MKNLFGSTLRDRASDEAQNAWIHWIPRLEECYLAPPSDLGTVTRLCSAIVSL